MTQSSGSSLVQVVEAVANPYTLGLECRVVIWKCSRQMIYFEQKCHQTSASSLVQVVDAELPTLALWVWNTEL